MSSLVTLTHFDGVAVITIDNPPVNALSAPVGEEVMSAMSDIASDPAVIATVVMGAGRTFVAGADIRELADGKLPRFHELLLKIEDMHKPVVMALHGTALGGGLELAMAGHYRIANASAQFGQPEVNLGLIPGAEGTQRLPRLIGIAKAIEMCVTGKAIAAPDALSSGLIDGIVEGNLLAGAIAFSREKAQSGGPHPKTRKRSGGPASSDANALSFAAGRELARKTRRNQTAPLVAIEAIESAATLPFEEGVRREAELFAQCLGSDQSKALIHAFFAERAAAKTPGVGKNTAVRSIRKIGIVGAGTMGGGIAMACANAGFEVLIRDATDELLQRGVAKIRGNYDASVKRGRISDQIADERMTRITATAAWDGFDEVDLIIEAAFESLAVKEQIFGELDRIAPADCILATNTSTLDVDRIAAATRRPASVVGLHFFSPAQVMRLLEIVRGGATSAEVLATAQSLAKRLGKIAVVAGNGPGFIGNRMMYRYMDECHLMAEEGATPRQIDEALTDWGMAMGIFAVDDLSGIDITWQVRQEVKTLLKAGARGPLVTDKLYALGRLGQKTNAGWYRYDENRQAQVDEHVLSLIEETARAAGIERRTLTTEEILDRALFSMINEAAKVLEEGIALRAGDIDTVYLNGYGFPAYRGGPMWYADTVGLDRVYVRVLEFERIHGERWAPAALLTRLVREGRTFSSLDL